MHGNFRYLALTHQNAPLAWRERMAFSKEEAAEVLRRISEVTAAQDLLLVSTCNRTELFYSAADDLFGPMLALLSVAKGVDAAEVAPYFEASRSHDQAVRHLFRVGLGLESQVVGDMQIINQVKQAYQTTADLHLAGPFLHRLLHTLFFANKKVVQETAFRDGAASTSYAAVELIDETLAGNKDIRVLALGLGEIGQDVVSNLLDAGYTRITLLNRSLDKAQVFAEGKALTVAPLSELAQHLAEADVVISSVAIAQPLITQAMIRQQGLLRFQYFIDLSVPRSIEPEVENWPGAIVFNIDHLQSRASEALQRRLEAIPHVERIMDEALVEFADWSQEMVVSPTIQKLKNALESIRQEEMARFLKSADEVEAKLVDRVTASMLQKIIKLPVLQLKAACKRGEAETLVDVLNDLFDLEKQEEKA